MSMPDKIWVDDDSESMGQWIGFDDVSPSYKGFTPYISQAAHERAIEEAVEAEREACAKIVDEKNETPKSMTDVYEGVGRFQAKDIAAAIRSRGESDNG